MGTSADKFQYLADTKDLIKTAIIGKGQTIAVGDTFRSYATKIGNISSECTAVASNILSGKTAYSGGSKITGTIASKGIQTYSPSTSAQTIASGQYLSGTQTISAVTGTAIASNVLATKTFASASGVGLTGTMENHGVVDYTFTNTNYNYNFGSGYFSSATAHTAISNLVAGNIKSGVNVGGVVGTLPQIPYTAKYTYTCTTGNTADGHICFIVDVRPTNPTITNDNQLIYVPSGNHPLACGCSVESIVIGGVNVTSSFTTSTSYFGSDGFSKWFISTSAYVSRVPLTVVFYIF